MKFEYEKPVVELVSFETEVITDEENEGGTLSGGESSGFWSPAVE